MTWAITVGQKPGLILKTKKSERSDAPKTISGVAIGKKISRLELDRPLNWYRPIAKAIIVPRIVAKVVASKPIFMELPSALQTSGAPQGFFQLLRVKPFQIRLLFPESLKENAKV
ncbi:unannotated protein [freshwater metagenome]|uniref:Unannotated protein n=1 Tax=freshwater metagenome TaxID=449393 RepID=A0A6J6QZA9_9ZZZZ